MENKYEFYQFKKKYLMFNYIIKILYQYPVIIVID